MGADPVGVLASGRSNPVSAGWEALVFVRREYPRRRERVQRGWPYEIGADVWTRSPVHRPPSGYGFSNRSMSQSAGNPLVSWNPTGKTNTSGGTVRHREVFFDRFGQPKYQKDAGEPDQRDVSRDSASGPYTRISNTCAT